MGVGSHGLWNPLCRWQPVKDGLPFCPLLGKALQVLQVAQVVQVLQDGYLPQQQPMGDTLGHHEPGHQMLNGAGLTAMGSKDKSVETPLGPEVVKDRHVGVHVVQVVGVGRVLVVGPLLGDGDVAIKKGVFRFAFIVYRVKAADVPKIKVGCDVYFGISLDQ